jgi:hypothetical protein
VAIEVSKWSKYSNEQKEKALKKQWFVYFSYLNPKTDLLEKQSFIKGGVNHYKTKEERLEILETYKRNLSRILKDGYNPYESEDHEAIADNQIILGKKLDKMTTN